MVAGIAPRNSGFSLIELLVAVTIASTLAVGVTLAFARGDTAASDAARLSSAFEEVRDRALSAQTRHGLRFGDDGWRVLRYDPAARVWVDAGGGRWSRGTAYRARWWRGDGPDVVFLPDGRTSALRIELFEGARRILCGARGWEPLQCT